MASALAQVKKELGADAVILHTRTFARGGLLGFGRKRVVEITAGADVHITPRPRRHRPPNPAQPQAAGRPQPPTPRRADLGADPAAGAGSDRLLRALYGRSAAGQSPAGGGEAGAGRGCAVAAPAGPAEPPSNAGGRADAAVATELRQLRDMVTRVVKATDSHARPDLPEPLFRKYLSLLQQELAAELAEEVVRRARDAVGDDADAARIDEAVGSALAELLPSAEAMDVGAAERQADGRPRTIALIGPTGVGKTTTVAKLAAAYKLREKRNVALITIDTYRIAAVDQLRSYAQIIGVPLHVAQSPLELKQALNRCRGCDAVLIDTAGRSQRDDSKLDELRSFLDAADPHEVHLVLASTATQRVLEEAVDRFSAIRADRIIFTKLDEAVSFGVVVNIVRRVNKQLSFITTGQDVPRDIERGEGARLAGLLLSGEL